MYIIIVTSSLEERTIQYCASWPYYHLFEKRTIYCALYLCYSLSKEMSVFMCILAMCNFLKNQLFCLQFGAYSSQNWMLLSLFFAGQMHSNQNYSLAWFSSLFLLRLLRCMAWLLELFFLLVLVSQGSDLALLAAYKCSIFGFSRMSYSLFHGTDGLLWNSIWDNNMESDIKIGISFFF